jgi:hypothetical protein
MNKHRNISIALLAGALLLTSFAGNALAWSSAACTDITNRASLTFFVGGVDQGILESSPTGNSTLGATNGADTLVRVDSKVDLDVSLISAQPLNATGVNQVLTFRITNLGNDTQQYGLQLFEGIDTTDDDFNMSNVRVYVDANNDEIWDGGDTLINGDIGGTGPAFGADLSSLTGDVLGAVGANDNTLAVFVVSDVPAGQPSTETAAYALRAISYQSVAAGGAISITDSVANGGVEANNSCGNPVVVGDVLETNTAVGGVTDEARDGAAFDSGAYTVLAGGVSVQKLQSIIWDPVNLGVSPQAIPGAYVQYQIVVSNTAGAAPATLTEITDALVTQLTFDVDLATAGPGTFENALGDGFKVTHVSGRALGSPLYYTSTDGDADGASITGATITAVFADLLPAEVGPPVYDAGQLLAGESVTLTFNAVIQ